MKRKYYNKVLSVLLTTGIIASLVAYPSQAYAQNEDIMEQALESLQTKNLKMETNILEKAEIDPQIDTKSNDQIKVIVELKGSASTLSNEQINTSHESFKAFINDLNKAKSTQEITIKEEYTNVFNGMSLTMTSSDVEKLLQSNEVQKIWLDQEIKLEPVQEIDTKSKKKETKIDSVKQIEADKLHKKGVTGKGVKVGVLDTGLDYNHPDLKDNYKGGYDCVDDDNDPMEATYEDWQNSGEPEYLGESYYYTEHGTHVAGSIGGTGKSKLDQAVKGVAPDADLYAYRVLGPYGRGMTSDILQGIELSVKDGMDVINLSLGANSNDPYSPLSQAVNNAMLKGTTVVIAAGNSGPDAGTLGSPGAASFPITVGASSASVTREVYEIEVGDNEYEIKSIAKGFDNNMKNLEDEEFDMVYVQGGEEHNYINLGIESVKDQVVLIDDTNGNLGGKIKLAKSKGAKAVLMYSQSEEVTMIDEDKDYIPAFTTTATVGEEIKALIASGENEVEFDESEKVVEGSEELAWFSSQGPGNYEFDIKPDVVAPGVDVYSTVPSYINDKENNNYDYAYERMNGTSMATPHVAGAAALIKQKDKDANPFDIKRALMNTSEKLDLEYGVNQVGSGRINVYDAVNTDIEISIEDDTKIYDGNDFVEVKEDTGSLSFGKYNLEEATNGFEKEKEIKITNNSNKNKTYSVDVKFFNDYPASNAVNNNVELKDVPKEIKVNKKSTKTINPKIVVPQNAEKGSYQGYITLTNKSDKKEIHQIPFSTNFSEEGIKSVEHLREGTSTKYDELFDPLVEAGIEFSSHMSEIAVFVQDYENKEIIGLSAHGDISQVPVNVPLRLGSFNGVIYPIENGEVVERFEVLPEGDYNLIYYATDALGKTYQASDYVWVDNTTPELTFEKAPGVYELEANQVNFNIKGTSYDRGIENVMGKTETHLDQSWTNVYSYEHNNFVTLEMMVPNVDGSFETNYELDLNKDINRIAMSGIDIFGAGSLREKYDYYVVKPGTSYVYSSFDKTRVNPNEEFTMSVAMNNVNNFENAEFEFDYIENHEIVEGGVKLSKEFIDMAAKQGYEFEVVLDKTVQNKGLYNSNKISINTITKGAKELNITEQMNIFEVKLNATGEAYYNPSDWEVYEEALISSALVNNTQLENILNTSFIYNIAIGNND